MTCLALLLLGGGVADAAPDPGSMATVDDLLHVLETELEMRFHACGDLPSGASLCARTDTDAKTVRTTVSAFLSGVAREGTWSRHKKSTLFRIDLDRRELTLTVHDKKPGVFAEVVPALSDCGDDPRLAHVDELTDQPGYVGPQRIKGTGNHPVFPEQARTLHARGFIEALATIDSEGRVTDICLLKINHRGLGFEAAFFSAVREWRYQPATIDGNVLSIPFVVTTSWDIR